MRLASQTPGHEDRKAPVNPQPSASMTGAGWGLTAREPYFLPNQSSRKNLEKI